MVSCTIVEWLGVLVEGNVGPNGGQGLAWEAVIKEFAARARSEALSTISRYAQSRMVSGKRYTRKICELESSR